MSERGSHHREERRRYRIGGPSARADLDVGAGLHVDDLLPAYVLGALDDDERREVDRHVAVCDRCAGVLAEDQRTVGLLPFQAPRIAPPPDVKVALFARIAHAQRAETESAAIFGAEPRRPVPPALTIPASRPAAAPAASVATAPAPRPRSRFAWVPTALTAPLLVALIGTGLWGMQLRDQVSTQSAQIGEMEARFANFGAGGTTMILQPGPAMPQAEGRILLGSDEKAGMVAIDLNADQPEEGAPYQVWAVEDGNLVPVAEVRVDQQGQGQAPFELEQPYGEYDSFHVQAKPADGETSADALSGSISGGIGDPSSGSDAIP